MICATLLMRFHYPLPWPEDEPLVLPPLYLIGVWLSILLAIGYISIYAWQIIEESRQLSDALVATELVLTREHYLSQLDGLAAAAAHELGTPLSTILVVARELEREIAADSPHADDIRLLREQAQRCRVILGKLTELPAPGEPFERDRQGRSARTGRRAQSGGALRPRQYSGKRGRFCPRTRRCRGVLDRRPGDRRGQR
jgi:two-component system sensor histidine kinase RegB